MNKIDAYTAWLVDLCTSRTMLIVTMFVFLGGLVQHLNGIFDNWMLSISSQLVILLLTVNSKYLPSIKTKGNAPIPIINFMVALFMVAFLYTDISNNNPAEAWSWQWLINIAEALFFSIIEIAYAYLFTARSGHIETKHASKVESGINLHIE